MNPQQPNGSFPPEPLSNPYEFITAPPPKPPRSSAFKLGGGDSFVRRIALIAGGAIILMIVLALVINLIFGNRGSYDNLISLAQTQQEISRIAAESRSGISDQAVASAGINTRLTLITQQQTLVLYLNLRGKELSSKELALKRDSTTDETFKQAKATSTFDSVFTQTLRQQLTDYSTALATAYKNATGKEIKKILATDYEQTQLLLKQIPES